MSSGPVPRELVAGVVWDAAAEELFLSHRDSMVLSGRFTEKQAAQEALWSVEAGLHRRFIKGLVVRGDQCQYDREKQEVFAEWRRLYGSERAGRVAAILKDAKLKAKVLAEW